MSKKNNDIIEEVVELETTEKGDSIKIAPDVVASIAGVAAMEIEGVSGMYTSFAGGIAQKLGAKKNVSKGIKVDIKEQDVEIDVYIVIEYGAKIPEIAVAIQENVKNNVETMTGLNVSKVNIHIDGVSFKKQESEEASTELEEDEIIIEETILEEIPQDDESQVL